VAYQRGTLLIERNLPTDCIPVPASSVAEIFKMLKTGVADVSINVEPAQSPLHPLAVAASIGRLDDALERVPLHHYLLDSHRELGERLNVVLKRMQASGEIQTIRTKTLGAAK
jgi:ABC-type amino acid transport substrate-binding protein